MPGCAEDITGNPSRHARVEIPSSFIGTLLSIGYGTGVLKEVFFGHAEELPEPHRSGGAYRSGKSGPCRRGQQWGVGRRLRPAVRKGHGPVRFGSILLWKIFPGFFRYDQLRPVVPVEEQQLAGGFLRWLPAGHQQVVEQVEAVVGQGAHGKCDENSCPVHGSEFLRVSWICSGSQGCWPRYWCRA